MKRTRAVIVEDETVLRTQLEDLLAKVWPELVIAASAEDGESGLQALDEHRPDVMFLDIQMPGMTGLELAQRASGLCHVVFVTAYTQYAVSAFEAGAVDYVLKPFNEARLRVAIERVKERLKSKPVELEGLLTELATRVAQAKPYLRWVTVARGANVRLLTVDEIVFFQSDSRYTRAVTADSESLIRTPLKELADQLDPAQFWQIHRSTIVNLSAIDSVARDTYGHLTVRLRKRPENLRVSQPFAHLFRQM